MKDPPGFEALLASRLASNDLSVIVSRRPCILAAADIRAFEKANAEKAAACPVALRRLRERRCRLAAS